MLQAADWRTGTVAVRASAWIVLQPWCRNRRSPTLPRAQACGLCWSHWAPVPSALRLLCAHTRGLCWCQAADWRDRCGCRVCKRVDCACAPMTWPSWHVGCCARRRTDCAARTGHLCPRCCGCRARKRVSRSSAWTVEAGVCPATPTSQVPPAHRARVRIRRRAGNGPRRVRAPMP